MLAQQARTGAPVGHDIWIACDVIESIVAFYELFRPGEGGEVDMAQLALFSETIGHHAALLRTYDTAIAAEVARVSGEIREKKRIATKLAWKPVALERAREFTQANPRIGNQDLAKALLRLTIPGMPDLRRLAGVVIPEWRKSGDLPPLPTASRTR